MFHGASTRGNLLKLMMIGTALVSTEVYGQTTTGKTLSDVEVVTAGTCSRITVRFNENVQLLSYFPQTSGRELHVRIKSLSGDDSRSRESLRTPEGTPSLRSISYEGDNPSGPVLSLFFTRDMQFSVSAGLTPNTLNITIDEVGNLGGCLAATRVLDDTSGGDRATKATTPDQKPDIPIPPGLYVVNLKSESSRTSQLTPSQLAALEGSITYESRFERDGQNWFRVRSGFYSTKEEAAAAREKLLQLFPDAWITKVSADERQQGVVTRIRTGAELPTATTLAAPDKPASQADVEAVSKLKSDAESAIKADEFDRAVQLLTKALTFAETPDTPRSLELLGLMRERKGQNAHAQAEYEEYLRRFPENEGADRVRQRLAALKNPSASGGTQVLRTPDGKERVVQSQAWKWGVRGSFGQIYLRDQSTVRAIDATKPPTDPDALLSLAESVNLNQLLTNADATISLGNDRQQMQFRASGSYSANFNPGRLDSKTLTSLYFDYTDSDLGGSIRLGRQTRNNSGIFGRFDGAIVGFQASKKIRVNAFAGFPVESSRQMYVEKNKTFYGTSLDFGAKRDKLQSSVYFFNQRSGGMTDRQAVGAEVRFFTSKFNTFGLIDYDVKFKKVNLGLVSLNYNFPDSSALSVTADYRTSPLLTASKATEGQIDPVTLTPIKTLKGLRPFFTDPQIYQLAKDRNLLAKSVSVTYARPIVTKLQANFDFTLTDTGGSQASGGVAAVAATGKEKFYGAQLVGSGLLWANDIFILSGRFADANAYKSYTADINARVPISNKMRLSPRARYGIRKDKAGTGTFKQFQPTMRFNYYPVRNSEVEIEVGGNFTRQVRTMGALVEKTTESGIVINAGYRLDF